MVGRYGTTRRVSPILRVHAALFVCPSSMIFLATDSIILEQSGFVNFKSHKINFLSPSACAAMVRVSWSVCLSVTS